MCTIFISDIKEKQNISEYKAVILDMDGTLYYQKPLQLAMAFKLLKYYLIKMNCAKDLYVLYRYRRLREQWKNNVKTEDLEEEQYRKTAEMTGKTAKEVRAVVELWMHRKPLEDIYKYRDKQLFEIIQKLRTKGTGIIVYSDFPVQEKLKALQLDVSACFCSKDKELLCMKPDKKGMEVILDTCALSPDEVLMIGDRFEKDGLAARQVNMNYVILPSAVRKRNKIYQAQFYKL